MEDLNDVSKNNDLLKNKTQKCFTKVKSGFDPKGHVVDTLFQERIITAKERDEIESGPDKETRARNVLSHLFQTSHPQAFVVFREALKEDYGWIVEMIDSTGKYDHLLNSVYCMVAQPADS